MTTASIIQPVSRQSDNIFAGLGRGFARLLVILKLEIISFPIMVIVVLIYFFTRTIARRNSMHFWSCFYPGKSRLFCGLLAYFHFFNYARLMMERLGKRKFHTSRYLGLDNENIREARKIARAEESGRPLVLITSHTGGYSYYEFLSRFVLRKKAHMVMLLDDEKYSFFQKKTDGLLGIINSRNVIQSVLEISAALNRRETIIFMGDRITNAEQCVEKNTGGIKMNFPLWPWQCAVKFQAAVLCLFIIRTPEGYRLKISELAENSCPENSEGRLQQVITGYAEELGGVIRKFPFQWFNYPDPYVFNLRENPNRQEGARKV
ncbi:MAG: hypothetical protein A2096_14180 [Spirochaetes bacterium GWF1_41_5]|nr:MAG: hypothetical protein A2096_14180 [Spirochaetes bacterium GWF1_41_5]HBE01883.1 hypothetical protein [Spirochaetia bacterium]